MSGFLLLLVKTNLAMGAAIVLVSLIRRFLRAQFGAPIAYAIWLLVPIATAASLLPPREIPPPAQIASVQTPGAPAPVTGQVPQATFDAIEQLALPDVIVPPTPVKPLGSSYEIFDAAWLIFTAWVLGLLLMAAYLTRVQIRFSAAVQRGQAGPAVVGFFRPRIVTPAGFEDQFTPEEQSAILAHERVHLARQDARINALVALLRCLCWFNPLIHLGARWLRIDQELACDAIAVSGAISRRDYSMALLKSQVMVGVLPFGCNWPGPQHPLVERIALLQRKPPGAVRRFAGAGFVLLTAMSAGLGAWAAQPPVTTKVVTSEQPSMAAATFAATAPAQDQPTGKAGQPDANPTGSSNDVGASNNVRASRMASAAPVAQIKPSPDLVTATNAQGSAAPTIRSPAAAPLSKDVSASETDAASNDPPAAPVLPPPNASPALALNDQHGGQAAARERTAGSAQTSLNAPPKLDTNKPYTTRTCAGGNPINTRDGAFIGRVTSSTSVQVPYFAVCRKTYGEYAGWAPWARQGRCENNAHMVRNSIWGPYCPVEPWFTISLLFTNPADASKMPLGKVVRLKGTPFIITQNNVDYLGLKDAKLMYADPFGRSGPERSAMTETPKQLPNAAAAPGNAITPTKPVSAPEISLASNNQPPASVLPPPNASPAVALNSQPVAPPTARELSVGPDQARLNTPPATPAKFDPNAPYKTTICNMLDMGPVMGLVTSPTTIQLPSFSCARTSAGGPTGAGTLDGGNGYRMSFNLGTACRKTHTKFISSIWGPVCPLEPLLTITVQFANPADSSKMSLGKVVTLKGDRFVITQNKVDYLGVKNARILYADPFGRSGPERSAMIETPKQLPNAAAAPGNAITPTKPVSAPEISSASNGQSPAPVLPPPNASPAVALNSQPVAPSTARELAAGPVLAKLNTPPATPAKFDPNAPYKIKRCTGTVTGRVTSSTAIQIPNVVCGGFSGGGASNGGTDNGTGPYGGFALYSGACKGPQTSWAAEANLSLALPSCTNRPLLTMTVEFANPADAGKMPLGKLVRLKGDFRLITQNKASYLLVQNARLLYADPFGR